MKYRLMVRPAFARDYHQEGELFDTREEAEEEGSAWGDGGCQWMVDEVPADTQEDGYGS